MTDVKINVINWIVVCVNEFSHKYLLDVKTAFEYLYNYGGIDFLEEYYEAEHTLSFDEAVEDLQLICKNNGGKLI